MVWTRGRVCRRIKMHCVHAVSEPTEGLSSKFAEFVPNGVDVSFNDVKLDYLSEMR